jgi:Domain of unknown function (DUF4333)
MRRALVLVTAALTVGTVFIAAAPSVDAATLNTTATRRAISERVTATYPGLPFGNVSCPNGITRKQGVRFTCTVQIPGAFIILDATQTDGGGSVTFETRQAVVPRQAVDEFVAANASLPGLVLCGTTPWLVLRPGQELNCHAELADGSQHDAKVAVRDTAGNVTITGVT